MTPPFISFDDGDSLLDWIELTDVLAVGHSLPRATIGDTFLYRDPDTLLSRSAWIDGLGVAVKTATIFPGNPDRGKPMVNGAVCLYDDADGSLSALVDFHLVTKWKTAGDSLLAARRLARPDSAAILIIGAGTVGRSLCHAYGAAFPDAKISLWNRTMSKAADLAATLDGVSLAPDDLQTAVAGADIISCATMSSQPVLKGEWLQPGQHVDLIGAYRPDMREADDAALVRARVFVDSFDTTVDHIGEIREPLASGAITRDHLLADYYDLAAFQRQNDDEITLFKNGGGAHLDLMTSRHILDKWRAR